MIRRAVIFIAWVYGVLLSATPAANGADFEVSGFLIIRRVNLNQKVTQYFDVIINDCRALIVSSNVDDSTGYMSLSPQGKFTRHTNVTDRVCIEIGFENATEYKLTRFYRSDGIDTAAEVNSLDMPDDEVNGIVFLWCAYGSACYFSEQTNHFIEPIWSLENRELKVKHFKEKADWVLNDEAPFLPQSIVYYSDGKLRGRVNGIAYTNLAPAPYDHGFTNFTYEVLSSSNQAGIEIPTEFRCVRYEFPGTLTPEPLTVVSGRVDKFTVGTVVATVQPAFEGKLEILDKRYGSSNPPVNDLLYPAYDGNWKGTNEDQIYRHTLKRRRELGQHQASQAIK